MVFYLWLCWEWSVLWHQHTEIMKCPGQLLCRWDWTWVPCCPYVVPWGLPWESTQSRNSQQHLHCRLLACSWKTLIILASRRSKLWRMTLVCKPNIIYIPPLFLFRVQPVHIWSTELHKKYVPAFSVAPMTLFQSLVKVKVRVASSPHQSQPGMRFCLKFPGIGSRIRGSLDYSVMDAHHLLALWDYGFIPTHMSAISKKWKATLIVLSGASIGLAGTPDLDLEVGSAVSQELGKMFSTNHCTADWNSQANDCCNWRVCAAEQHLYNLIYIPGKYCRDVMYAGGMLSGPP